MSRTDKAQTAEDKVNKVRELLRKDQWLCSMTAITITFIAQDMQYSTITA